LTWNTAWIKIGQNPLLQCTEHENTNDMTAIFGSANSLNSKISGGSKMTFIDLEYGMDENWPKSFPEVY